MRFCLPNLCFVLLILILGTASLLSACGQKGDLYLPEPEPKEQEKKKDKG